MPQQMQRQTYYQVPGSGPTGPPMHGARPRWPATNPMQRLQTNAGYGGPPRPPSGRHGGPPVSNAARLVQATPRPITGPASIPTRQPTTARPPQARQAAAFNTAKPIRSTVGIIEV